MLFHKLVNMEAFVRVLFLSSLMHKTYLIDLIFFRFLPFFFSKSKKKENIFFSAYCCVLWITVFIIFPTSTPQFLCKFLLLFGISNTLLVANEKRRKENCTSWIKKKNNTKCFTTRYLKLNKRGKTRVGVGNKLPI